MLQITREAADSLGFDLADAVASFAAEVEAHRDTVDVPAPTAHPVVELIVRQHGGEFTILEPPEPEPEPDPGPPTVDDVIAERERRLALGFDYDFGDDRGVHRIGTTAQDMVGWREVTDLANACLAASAGATPIMIVTDTGPTTVTASEWTEILIAAGAARQPLWAASFVLQAMDPIPADFADDGYWDES
jgi:hypothetical protein